MSDLREQLLAAWDEQAAGGFLLTPPGRVESRTAPDAATGAVFRFVWLPHREIRHDADELERRGIVDPACDRAALFADPRGDGSHCFLCPANIRLAHPREILIDVELAGRPHVAGANFAWTVPHHFTVMAADHTDQRYSDSILPTMVELHAESGFRVTFHGPGVGATIPWHLHYQITTEPFPIEQLTDERAYPTAVRRFPEAGSAHRAASDWIASDPDHHDVNLLVAGERGAPAIFLFPRDRRRSHAGGKGLIGVFEVSGHFVFSSPDTRAGFEQADASTVHEMLAQVRPDEPA